MAHRVRNAHFQESVYEQKTAKASARLKTGVSIQSTDNQSWKGSYNSIFHANIALAVWAYRALRGARLCVCRRVK